MQYLIPVLDAALDAGLSKRQWAAFVAILRQTVGYRKRRDDISARRLEQLTGIQRNHIWRAKHELETLGLVDSQPGRYGERLALTTLMTALEKGTAQVGESETETVADTPKKSVSTPPNSGGQRARFRREARPKRATTLSNPTQVNHTLPQDSDLDGGAHEKVSPQSEHDAASSPLPYPPDLSPQERQQAAVKLDGLQPAQAQQVVRIWQLKIERGEVRKSRLGLLHALVQAARQGTLDTRLLEEQQTQHQRQVQWQQRESWIERQTQARWLKEMANLQSLSVPEVKQMLAGNQHTGGGYECVA